MSYPLILATHNQKKRDELLALSAWSAPVHVLSELPMQVDWQEDGNGFAENAYIKANALRLALDSQAQQVGLALDGLPQQVCQAQQVGLLADDSGLEVDALGGRPGIKSARYAGDQTSDADNVKKLLLDLEHVPAAERKARYVCCLYFWDADGTRAVFWGHFEGYIARTTRGEGGFGYDPVFAVPPTGTHPAGTYSSSAHPAGTQRSGAESEGYKDLDEATLESWPRVSEWSAAEKNAVSHRAQAMLQWKRFVIARKQVFSDSSDGKQTSKDT